MGGHDVRAHGKIAVLVFQKKHEGQKWKGTSPHFYGIFKGLCIIGAAKNAVKHKIRKVDITQQFIFQSFHVKLLVQQVLLFFSTLFYRELYACYDPLREYPLA